ncbi:MAG: hypothetical protein K1060chlam2_00346 [Chlamydiae bacterium]|nr:hypothetical protein [Chlamydiota bacterium]
MKKTLVLALSTLSLVGLPLFADGEEEVKEPVALEDTSMSRIIDNSLSCKCEAEESEESEAKFALGDDEEEAKFALGDDEEEAKFALGDDEEEAKYIS